MMRRMAIQAAYVAGLVRRAQKVAVFFAILMACQAALHDFRSGNFFEPKDFCRIALAFDVRSSRPMTSFAAFAAGLAALVEGRDRKSTRLNSSHSQISYAVFCLKKKKKNKKI